MKYSLIKATSIATGKPSWIATLFGRKWMFIHEDQGVYGITFRGVVYNLGSFKAENGVLKLPSGYKTKHILDLLA